MTSPERTTAPDRKTAATDADVEQFLTAVAPEPRQRDAREVAALMARITGTQPRMWGPSIIGFGSRPYTTADGKRREWFAVGLSPRKAALTMYGLTDNGSNSDLLERLGAHTTGKGCLYVKRLHEVDEEVLGDLIRRAWTAQQASS